MNQRTAGTTTDAMHDTLPSQRYCRVRRMPLLETLAGAFRGRASNVPKTRNHHFIRLLRRQNEGWS
jgi:hypothetical protein